MHRAAKLLRFVESFERSYGYHAAQPIYQSNSANKHSGQTININANAQQRQPNKKPFDVNQTAFMAFFGYAFCIGRKLRDAKNCKTFIIGAQEGTRTPTMLLAST
jgi:hypothetical protein